MLRNILITLFVLTLAFGVMAQEAAVTSMEFCTEVVDHEAVGVADEFPADVDRVCCLTKIENAADTIISHVWFYEGEEMAKVELSVRADQWRTWSSKKVVPEWTGVWRVDVVAEDGKVLESKEFTVTE